MLDHYQSRHDTLVVEDAWGIVLGTREAHCRVRGWLDVIRPKFNYHITLVRFIHRIPVRSSFFHQIHQQSGRLIAKYTGIVYKQIASSRNSIHYFPWTSSFGSIIPPPWRVRDRGTTCNAKVTASFLCPYRSPLFYLMAAVQLYFVPANPLLSVSL